MVFLVRIGCDEHLYSLIRVTSDFLDGLFVNVLQSMSYQLLEALKKSAGIATEAAMIYDITTVGTRICNPQCRATLACNILLAKHLSIPQLTTRDSVCN